MSNGGFDILRVFHFDKPSVCIYGVGAALPPTPARSHGVAKVHHIHMVMRYRCQSTVNGFCFQTYVMQYHSKFSRPRTIVRLCQQGNFARFAFFYRNVYPPRRYPITTVGVSANTIIPGFF